jgi:uncharacterized protein (TIGR00251 family)
MIAFTEKDDTIVLNVRVAPRASKSEIVGEHDGALKVRIASPPVDGAANEELIKFLAKSFGAAKNAVEIVSGHSSRLKRVAITGASPEKTALILQAKI